MSKTLVLMRHGKSSWKDNLPDDERLLKQRAYKDIEHVASAFKHCLDKDFVFKSSYAERAESTAKHFLKQLEIPETRLHIESDLYTFDESSLKAFLYTIDDSLDNLMLFGHNPAFTNLANTLGDQYFDNLPTSGLVMMHFKNSSWKDLASGKTILHLFPKNLR
ncbi:MAG: histidine phosphatase family protein [Bacteroidetes bacterium]|jgi:phosphohistidine phosphatase|nr:histidine phosphatase family protein [Bacteroidota bacterium]